MSLIDVKVPDIGDFKDVPIIDVQVKSGDLVKVEDPIVTLESDKATMDVPAPAAGRVAEVLVKIGDRVSEGSALLKLEPAGAGTTPSAPRSETPKSPPAPETKPEPPASPPSMPSPPVAKAAGLPPPIDFSGVHARPSVRRLARELDIDLTRLKGSGEKGRVSKEDVKRALAPAGAPAAGAGIPEIPAQDFSKFGPVETKPLSRLKRLSGPHLHRAWLNIPHVTHTDEADITDLEAYRKTLDGAAKEKGYRVT